MADVTIVADGHNNADLIAQRGGVFWTTPLIGYVIYVDAPLDLKYQKTEDGGATWGGAVNIKTGTIKSYDCWADWQTEGDAGTKIHIAYIGSDDIRYVYLDTDGDSVGGDDQIENSVEEISATLSRQYHHISITKTRGGNLAVAYRYTNVVMTRLYGFRTSPDADTWTSEASPWEADFNDFILLFPGNETDNQDVWATFWDASANEIDLLTYDDSGNSWGKQLISADMAEYTSHVQMDGAIRLSDGHLIFAAWNLYNSVDADLMVWDINGAGSITAKTNVKTNTGDYLLVSVFINQVNDDIYVAYVGGTAAGVQVAALYKKSVDGGANWGGETALQADAEDRETWISAGAINSAWGGKFQPVWINDDLNDLFTNEDNGISIAAEAEAGIQDKSANMGAKMIAGKLI